MKNKLPRHYGIANANGDIAIAHATFRKAQRDLSPWSRGNGFYVARTEQPIPEDCCERWGNLNPYKVDELNAN